MSRLTGRSLKMNEAGETADIMTTEHELFRRSGMRSVKVLVEDVFGRGVWLKSI